MAFGVGTVPRKVNRDRARVLQLVAAAVISADGVVTEAEKSGVVELVKDEFGYAYSAKELDRDLAAGTGGLDELLDRVSEDLDAAGRETLVTAALLVAAVDGKLDERELEVVRSVGWGIGITKWRVQQVVDLGIRRLVDAGVVSLP